MQHDDVDTDEKDTKICPRKRKRARVEGRACERRATSNARKQRRQRQMRLEECKAFCRSRRPFIHTTTGELTALRLKLEAHSKAEIMEALRQLSVRTRHFAATRLLKTLKLTGLGRACGALRQHTDMEVANFAVRLIAAWRTAIAVLRKPGIATRPRPRAVHPLGAAPILCASSPSPGSSSSSSTSSTTSSSSSSEAPVTPVDTSVPTLHNKG